jgi:hypothetical protein
MAGTAAAWLIGGDAVTGETTASNVLQRWLASSSFVAALMGEAGIMTWSGFLRFGFMRRR